MINSVTFAPSYQPKAPAKAAPAPAPKADPAPDSVDFSAIDCPKKASMLPVLDPAVHVALVAGAISAAMGGNPHSVIIDVAIRAGNSSKMPGDNAINVNYILDPKNQKQPVTESGVVGQRFSWNALTVDQNAQSARFTGPHNYDDLALSVDQKKQTVRLDGHLGEVETHLEFSAPESGRSPQGDSLVIHTAGTLGSLPYITDTTIKATDKGKDYINASMAMRGKLGDADIHKDYDLTATDGQKGITLMAKGSGNHAGTQQSVDVSLRLAQ